MLSIIPTVCLVSIKAPPILNAFISVRWMGLVLEATPHAYNAVHQSASFSALFSSLAADLHLSVLGSTVTRQMALGLCKTYLRGFAS